MNTPLKAEVRNGAIVVDTDREVLNPDDRIRFSGNRLLDPSTLPQTLDRGQLYLVTATGLEVPFLNKAGARIWVTI